MKLLLPFFNAFTKYCQFFFRLSEILSVKTSGSCHHCQLKPGFIRLVQGLSHGWRNYILKIKNKIAMTLVKINKPFAPSFNSLVDEMFAEWPGYVKNGFNNSERKSFIPVNVKQTVKGYQLDVVAPGFEKADFNITLDNDLLTISAEAKKESEDTGKQIRNEYSYRSFKRSFTLDDKIDATNIEASYINGVLTLNLPKKETVKASATKIVIK